MDGAGADLIGRDEVLVVAEFLKQFVARLAGLTVELGTVHTENRCVTVWSFALLVVVALPLPSLTL
jgi:hypothetical protein